VGAIAYIISRIKGIPVEEVALAAWHNTMNVFFSNETEA
jgi:Tat protein secretion system quality control protein TatD with DNase activity